MSDFARLQELVRDTTPAPVVVDTPHLMIGLNDPLSTAARVGDELICTKGNWQGDPTVYDFAWRSDGTAVAGSGDHYVVQAADQGHGIDCLVTATNLGGSASAASNKINISGAT